MRQGSLTKVSSHSIYRVVSAHPAVDDSNFKEFKVLSQRMVPEARASERVYEPLPTGKKSVREINSWISFKGVRFAFLTSGSRQENPKFTSFHGSAAYAPACRRGRRWATSFEPSNNNG